ncbi:MAG: DUF2809 domain-containing protein [Defluviitaleaceae bacterium]|nr:DUF2809 domain-containing protein [Defluviitaleaceae bacterium]
MKIGFNIKYFIVFLALFIATVFIAIFATGVLREHIGDVIVVIVIYAFIKSFIKNEIKLLWLYIFIFSVLIEVSQYFNLVERLGFYDNTIIRVALGTTFDFWDIVCYFAGCMIILAFEKVIVPKYLKHRAIKTGVS